jgi:hypothetical protein
MYKFIKIAVIFMVLLIITTAALSLYKNYLTININHLNKEIALQYNELQNVKAQWNYLNNKNYLQNLIKKYAPNLVEYKLTHSNNSNKIDSIKNLEP